MIVKYRNSEDQEVEQECESIEITEEKFSEELDPVLVATLVNYSGEFNEPTPILSINVSQISFINNSNL